MSSAPHNERPWAPAELDALEDALDRLDAPQLPATLSVEQAQRIGGRLANYRAIAVLSRELLSSHVAPASAIAAAIAEARTAAVVPASADPAPAPARTSWWSRARRVWMLPTLASAGVGALVVVLSVSRDEAAPASVVAERAQSAKPIDAIASSPSAAQGDAPSSGLAMVEPAPPTATADGAADRGAAAQPMQDPIQAGRGRLRERDGDDALDAAKTKRADEDAPAESERKRSEPSAKDEPARPSTRAPAADPKPAPAPKKAPSQGPAPAPSKPASGGAPGGSKTDGPTPAALGDILLRANRARRGGDCTAARRDYELVMSRGDGRQRARAKAGTALCLEQDGADARAGDLIAGARLDDPSIDAWLASERARAAE